MALESATYINTLNSANPVTGDALSQGDDHLRLIKATILATFPAITGALAASHTTLDIAVAQAGTTGTCTLDGGGGSNRNVILKNTAGVFTLAITDTSQANPVTAITISTAGAVTLAAGLTLSAALIGTTGTFTSLAASGAVTAATATLSGHLISPTAAHSGAVSTGALTASGTLTGVDGTFSGAVSVASLAASGAVTAASATLSGHLIAPTAAHSGAVTAGSLASSGAVSGTTGAFTGALSTTSTLAVTGASTLTGGATLGASGVTFSDATVQTTKALSYAPTAVLSSSQVETSLPIPGTSSRWIRKSGKVTTGGATSTAQVIYSGAVFTSVVSLQLTPVGIRGTDVGVQIIQSLSTDFTCWSFRANTGNDSNAEIHWSAEGYGT